MHSGSRGEEVRREWGERKQEGQEMEVASPYPCRPQVWEGGHMGFQAAAQSTCLEAKTRFHGP